MRNGDESTAVIREKGGRVSIHVRVHGEPTQFINFSSMREAQTALEIIESRFDKPYPATDVDYNGFYELFCDRHLVPECGQLYLTHHEAAHRRYLSEMLGHMPLSDIDDAALDTVWQKLLEEHHQRYANGFIDKLSAVLGMAVKWRFIEKNPVSSWKP